MAGAPAGNRRSPARSPAAPIPRGPNAPSGKPDSRQVAGSSCFPAIPGRSAATSGALGRSPGSFAPCGSPGPPGAAQGCGLQVPRALRPHERPGVQHPPTTASWFLTTPPGPPCFSGTSLRSAALHPGPAHRAGADGAPGPHWGAHSCSCQMRKMKPRKIEITQGQSLDLNLGQAHYREYTCFTTTL
ncbi:cuticle collagen 1-like isoform X1 [Rhinopithecus roxellana]|uniref:cuticle collagen 1-like isoform X2 n=1 Tax=Rhinopithecus bieti TaxID=61621 RepID=UPI00083BBCB0|nr:PREDICTED: cuticle collagen 1-like isoform X2 [Rhinopithecus bieti]XP_030769298.1 cuticle collagen 1-like isoform X1 [Rhinopithecus roxellana]